MDNAPGIRPTRLATRSPIARKRPELESQDDRPQQAAYPNPTGQKVGFPRRPTHRRPHGLATAANRRNRPNNAFLDLGLTAVPHAENYRGTASQSPKRSIRPGPYSLYPQSQTPIARNIGGPAASSRSRTPRPRPQASDTHNQHHTPGLLHQTSHKIPLPGT